MHEGENIIEEENERVRGVVATSENSTEYHMY